MQKENFNFCFPSNIQIGNAYFMVHKMQKFLNIEFVITIGEAGT